MVINSSNILVTGGTGFVGRSLVQQLIADGHSVRIISRGGKRLGHPRITMYYGNITSLKDLRLAIKDCTAVFHCAAEKNDPKQMKEINISATQLLFDIATESMVNFFCHLSSVGVIGKTDRRIVDESTPCNPVNTYETTKYIAEEIVSQGLDGGNVVILRPTNIFGKETLTAWLENRLHSKMHLFLKGNENPHLVYVKDVVASAMYLFYASSANPVEKYIISCDEENGSTYREVQTYLASRIQTAPDPFAFSAPLFIPYYIRRIRNGNTNRGDVIYSSRKICAAGFRFPYGLQIGLSDVVSSLLNSSSLR